MALRGQFHNIVVGMDLLVHHGAASGAAGRGTAGEFGQMFATPDRFRAGDGRHSVVRDVLAPAWTPVKESLG